MQPELALASDAGHHGDAIVSVASDASMFTRWRALTLTDSVARIVRSARHAQVDTDCYDLHQLLLAAIDHAVMSRGFEQETSLDHLLRVLADLARRMNPQAPSDAQPQEIARLVVFGLLNDARDQLKFEYQYTDLSRQAARVSYRFHILELREGPAGPIVVASEQAITLFLQGLNIDLDDAEVALGVVLHRQLEDKRFEAAHRTATQAERITIAMSARLAEILDDTRRDVRTHDWLEHIPQELDKARAHVRSRIAEDGMIIGYVDAGMDVEDNPALSAAAGDLVDLLARIRLVHLDLSNRLAGARSIFLDAHLRQRLTRRERLRLLDIRSEILMPVLHLPLEQAAAVCAAFADAALSLQPPRIWRLGDLLDALWPTPTNVETPVPGEAERPGDIEGQDPQRYAPAVVAAAHDVFNRVRLAPAPLSELLDAAAATSPDAVDGAVDEVVELVALSSLWAYAPDIGDVEEEESAEVGALAMNLRAERTGKALGHPLADGDELLVTTRFNVSTAPVEDVHA